ARFPFATVTLEDERVPLGVEIEAWSPFEPGDADGSSLPVAALEYRLTNPGGQPLEAGFSFHARNFLAGRGAHGRRSEPGGFVLWGAGPPDRPAEGAELSISVTDPGAKVNCAWFRGGWWDPLTMAWRDVEKGASYDRPPVTSGDPSPG